MELQNRIETDLTAAMKSGQSDKVAVLRLVKNAFKNEQIKLGHELSQDEATAVLRREAKQRQQSIEAYRQGDRPDLEAAEQGELKLINEYLPAALDEAALASLVKKAVADLGVTDKAEMGRVIGEVMKQSQGGADGAVVARLVQQELS